MSHKIDSVKHGFVPPREVFDYTLADRDGFADGVKKTLKVPAKCLNPRKAWICGSLVCKDGVVSPRIVFDYSLALAYYTTNCDSGSVEDALADNEIYIPCGACSACLLKKRKDMTVRLSHELSCHDVEKCCMLTLTYEDESMPYVDSVSTEVIRGKSKYEALSPVGKSFFNRTLLPYDVQCFMKRLRRWLEYSPKKNDGRDHLSPGLLRYYAVGEYGTKTRRPHYHIILFGYTPSDLQYFFTRNGHDIFTSVHIQKLWRFGYSTVQYVNPSAAKYVARYVTKKMKTDVSYEDVFPEFQLQSVRNGGIGSLYLARYYKDMFDNGFCWVNGSVHRYKSAIPDYYKRRLRKIDLPFFLANREEKIAFFKSTKIEYDYVEARRTAAVAFQQDFDSISRDFF